MTASAKYTAQELRLLHLLSTRYPTVTAAHIEMINLHAILALPKGTDHYISDIHGAYDQFDHLLRHASGAVRRKIRQTFGDQLTEAEQIDLAMLVYYPELKLRQSLDGAADPDAMQQEMIVRLARLARTAAAKYTRSKVRKRLQPQLAYILDELLTESETDYTQKEDYFQQIIETVVELGEGQTFIVTMANLIQHLVVDRLYILGDIYDRGNAAEKVMDRLMQYPYVSIQWGNHDVSWMGAAAGGEALIANVIRLSLRYANVETLLDGYGMNLRRLARFADEVYGDDPATIFMPKVGPSIEEYTRETIARMHKAITIIQFKMEAAIIKRRPEYDMEDRLVLNNIDLRNGIVSLYGKSYRLTDTFWPTLHGDDPNALSEDEQAVIDDLREQFQNSKRLDAHMRYLYSYGNMFQVQDGNLKFHGCLPVDEKGEFVPFTLGGDTLAGPALLERYEQLCRQAYFSADPEMRQEGQDAMWYLWCGQYSPLFGRKRMTTFERYFVEDEATYEEAKGAYYSLRNKESFCRKVLAAFGGDVEHGHIINGHTPIKVRKGESPLRANGKMIVIDGGMSEAYQPVTGIAGYTLISNSHGTLLAAHEPFTSAKEMVARGIDVTPHTELIDEFPRRLLIADTDTGRELRGQLDDLHKLVDAYRRGILVENTRGSGGR